MNIEEARKKMNMSRKEVATWLDIPYRTMCSWENGERECPEYVEKLIVEKILGGKKNMKKYELKKRTTEIAWKDRFDILEGCTAEDPEPTTLKRCDTKEEAEKALKDCTTSIRELKGASGTFYAVEEYCIEENEYDEDDEWVSGGDILDWSKMNIEVIEKPTYRTLGAYSNYEEAEKAMNDYDGEDEVYMSF